MTVGTLLRSKYRFPTRRPGAVARPRLARPGRLAPLTVMSAPAGFGKTTLLTEWLASVSADVAFVSLDRRDNDPVLFWTYVVTALNATVPTLGEQALHLLAAPAPPLEDVLAALLNDIERHPTDVVLALDDYHLIEAPEVHAGLAFLLEHQPPTLRLVIATRVDPPLPLATLRARGHLVEVRAGDLRFTAGEATAYLNDSMGLGLHPDDVAGLEHRTEGWIAALQLAALSLQGRDDAGAFIAGFTGNDRYVVDYLVEEVLTRQPVGIRDFLLRTSILEHLTGPLCDAVTGDDGGGRNTLIGLERANLFVVPLDDRRQWYRYHHLFAEVLHAHLLDEHPGEVADLHDRASRWFEARGDVTQAIGHARAGGNAGRAADLIEVAVPVMRRDRREAEFVRWVRALPDDVLRQRPVLGVAFAGALAQTSDFATVTERLDGVEARLRPDGGAWPDRPPPGLVVVDHDAYRSLPAHVEMYRAAVALTRGDLEGTGAHARRALSLAPAGDALTRAASGALAGLAAWSGGDLPGAHAAYTESAAGLAGAGFRSDVLGCTITLADIRRTQGRLTDALHTYERALESAVGPPGAEPLRGRADMHVGRAGVLLERNELAAAREQLDLAAQLGEANGLPQNAYRSRVVRARMAEADGDPDTALALLDEAERVYVGDFAPDVQPVAAVRARLRLRRGELAPVDDWARQRQLTEDDESYVSEYEQLTLARLLLARHRCAPDGASLERPQRLLDRLHRNAVRGDRGATVIEILVLQALARAAGGDEPSSLAALHRAVTLAEAEGFVRLFLDEGPPLVALLHLLRRRPDAPGSVDHLLAAAIGTQTPASGARPLIDPLSDRELDVLRLLAGDLGGPDIARRLSVSLNTLRTHTKSVYAKLGVTSRRAAVTRAHDLDLIPGGRPS